MHVTEISVICSVIFHAITLDGWQCHLPETIGQQTILAPYTLSPPCTSPSATIVINQINQLLKLCVSEKCARYELMLHHPTLFSQASENFT